MGENSVASSQLMLQSMRLRDLRAFADTGPVEFAPLNIFIGANNAGKTTLLSAIELLFRSLRSNPSDTPLNFSEMPAFASFDAVVRRHWSRKERRPTQIKINYSLGVAEAESVDIEFICEADPGSGTSHVAEAKYKSSKQHATLRSKLDSAGARRFSGKLNKAQYPLGSVLFLGVWPIFRQRAESRSSNFSAKLFAGPGTVGARHALEVVKPFRPAPRSYYVLDDPYYDHEERDLITYLANLWDRKDERSEVVKGRIKSALKLLGLTTEFEVKKTSQKRGPKVLEIRVAPHATRQKVTIADAGFGLSQVLPLIASDARLEKGSFIAYQPEVHLHPYAQSRLADLFAASVGRGNQLFVESHSPDLILRLQLLILRGELKPDDVAVFCFERASGKNSVRRVAFDEGAAPNQPWPAGFLDTSLQTAREMNSLRLGKLAR